MQSVTVSSYLCVIICDVEEGQRSHMESSRVLEIIHDRGSAASPRWLLGSGFLLRDGIVLTAAHNLGGQDVSEIGPTGTAVRCLDGSEHHVVRVLARSHDIDFAVLAVPDLKASAVVIARIDRDQIDVVHDVMAAGFPNYKYAKERPKSQRRQAAQPVGSVSTVEDISAGTLTLKLEYGEPAPVATIDGSPWEGLSGAGVMTGERLIGVVIEHHPAEGLGSLRFVPFTKLSMLPEADCLLFCALLGIGDPMELPPVNISPVLVQQPAAAAALMEISQLESQGLLLRSEARTLRILAYKKAKGWS